MRIGHPFLPFSKMGLLSAIPFEAEEEPIRAFLPRAQEHSQRSLETWRGELHKGT